MPKQIIIAEQYRIAAVFSEDQIQELVVATGTHQVSDIYLGVVENVLPGIDAAFVNIGDPDRNGFIHVTDLGPLRLKRSSGAITELLSPQQKVLVQVMKEPTGNKGPRLTGNITLPGRYLVLMPFGRGVNLSRRIRTEAERNRLRALAILIKPAGMGLLVRTEAEGVGEEAILEDLEFLQKQWEDVQREAATIRPPALLNRDDDFIQRVLRDMYSADVNRIVVDATTGVKRVKQQLMIWNEGKMPPGVLIDEHRERTPILEYFRVNAAIREALKPRVDLPSGGYIIIQPTEALTVIDVNSGSFTRSATSRETVLWTNCEAATEIARQLRLRNIAGVIIVDFIDMDSRRDQLQVLEHFNKALKADKNRPQIAQLSELGLVELTRKRQGQNVYELFSDSCATCGGSGHHVHLPGEGDVQVEPIQPILPDVSDRLVVPSPVKETRIPEPTVRDVPDYESTTEVSELDLLNHPSYQELGPGSPRRRRRRRLDAGEGEETEETLKTTAVRSTSPILPGSREPKPEWTEPEPYVGVPAYALTNDRDMRSSKEDRPDRSDRNRRFRDYDKVNEPSEVIHVEMSPEEQDVYALMGISPLLLREEEVKLSKSAVISVTEPGESVSSFSEQSFDDEEPIAEADVEEESLEEDSPEENLTPVNQADADDDDDDDDISASDEEDNEDDSAGVATRRRRRRSSAAEG
ncbi:Rne/Rng family ribonuclease [Phormidium pseudopriestleyi FRX01]|uniref:Rne/Rng family ribonuclease n=1 Tax=Phormidium pseudopriestleyi FRX01 TaxID=1759528 RepID=A0ABS3FXJ0_9CYAN|nr:Rne/Rng family ribonuclease [Phormidium pseudopriestleyi]MBO0351859.1 Rne/Rng family ribonuclease [Phormidium pseudopriestleyi FRX01]